MITKLIDFHIECSNYFSYIVNCIFITYWRHLFHNQVKHLRVRLMLSSAY